MKKLFSALFIVMMIALACTMVASATDFEAVDGLYTVEYATDAADGTQFGMVVIEAAEEAAFALDEATIRYIDQAGAASGKVAFDAFAPMDLQNDGIYKVYIGGGALTEATLIGTLAVEAPAPTPEVTKVTISGETTVEEGKTITLTANVEKIGEPVYTVVWSSDSDVATVVDGVVTGVKAGVANITVTAGGKTDTVAVTVTSARMPGDVDGNGKVQARDASNILKHVAGETPKNFIPENADVDANGKIQARDSSNILKFIAGQGIVLK